MTVAAIRERLHDYISAADDKQIKAIYTILEDQIVNEPYDWSEDREFVAELDGRVRRYEAGIDKGYTIDEVEKYFEELKKQRAKRSTV
ncbi:hypothetical protein ACPPVU_24090 [Mucilaginibacter sp. McL0603]|uniref:hypothetical protein n=1 Tax=Mucilaginibacter sp. McL0603 TaxID=3415670 RepID=UPI003CEF11AC